jgi:tetratricopeptide (TPR) repeat protein
VSTGRADAEREPLFGRPELVVEIERLLDATRSGTGGGLLLSGVGGVGKTPFVHVARRRAAERGFRVAQGRALPQELPAPFSLLRALVASLQLEPRPDPTAARLVSEMFPLPPDAPDRAGNATPTEASAAWEPSRSSDELEQLLAPVGRTQIEGLGAVRAQFFDRLVGFFVRLASDRPLLIAVDDLHFADTSSLEVLARLAEPGAPARIAIVGTIGPLSEASPHTREFLQRPTTAARFRTIEIRPLLVSELAEFATWILGVGPSTEDVLRWHAETDGNPLFAELLVRAETGSTRGTRPVPSGTGGLVNALLARTRSLDDMARRVLTYAAVLGREFSFPTLAAVTGADEERITEAIDRLVRAGAIRERGGEVYEFVSEELRAIVDSELTETRRRILHRKIGAALEARGGTSDVELARHFYLGRADVKAVEYNLKAAESAGRSYAFEIALEHIERALAAEARRPDRDRRRELRMRTEEGRLLNEIGNLPRASEALEATVRLAREEPRFDLELGRALLALAMSSVERSDFAGAEPVATEAAGLLAKSGTPRDQLGVHRTLGTIYWRRADLPRAEVHQRAALELAEKGGDPLELGHALVDVGNTVGPRGPEGLAEARCLYERAATLFDSIDNHASRARVLMNLAVMERLNGQRDDAERDIRRALASAERSRSPIWTAYCLLNAGQWQVEGGDPEGARVSIDRAERLVSGLGEAFADQQFAMIRGMIAEAEGKPTEAETRYRDSLARARSMSIPAEASEVLFRLARLLERQGDVGQAREMLAEARRLEVEKHRPDLVPELEALETALAHRE